MKHLLPIALSILIVSGCASGRSNYSMMESYYTNEQKIVYNKVKPPYLEYRYPVRFGEKVLRIWIAPRVINDYILVEGHYTYITVSKSRWYVEPVKAYK